MQAFAATADVSDDLSNGPDSVPANNPSAVETGLAAFVFDTTANYAGRGNAAPGAGGGGSAPVTSPARHARRADCPAAT